MIKSKAMHSFKNWISINLLLIQLSIYTYQQNLPILTSPNHNLFATKTTYHDAYYKLLNNHNQIKDYNLPDQCKPKMLYLICRHATRYPSRKKAAKMNDKMYFLRDVIVANNNFSSDLINRFKNWKLRMQLDDDNRITDTGFLETRQLGMFCRIKF